MAKLKSEENELILAYIDDLKNGEIYNPFVSKEGFGLTAKKIIAELENLRRNILFTRSGTIEGYARVEQEIANVTHDLKTPLAVITGAVECLEDGINDKDYVQVIKSKTTEMNEIVLRIISSSRALAEEAKNQMKVVDASTFFTAPLEKYRYLIEGKNIKYIVKRAPKVLIAVSENEIISVLDNLLTNATKYTEKGKISISFHSSLKYLIIRIKDTGKGIKKEDLPFVFDRFFSGEKSRPKGGTGIGLNYVKTTIEAHGGMVNVESKENKGTSFTLFLPRVEPKKTRRHTSDQLKCLEASLRLFLFPFFWPIDLGRAIFYGVRDKKNKLNYYIHNKQK